MDIKVYKLVNDHRMPALSVVRSIRYKKEQMLSYEEMVAFMNKYFDMSRLTAEHMYILSFDNMQRPNGIYLSGIGSSQGCRCNIREIAIFLLLTGCEQFVVFHNHPNGNMVVSNEDAATTGRLQYMGEMLGLNFLDHYIISRNGYKSIKDNMPNVLGL